MPTKPSRRSRPFTFRRVPLIVFTGRNVPRPASRRFSRPMHALPLSSSSTMMSCMLPPSAVSTATAYASSVFSRLPTVPLTPFSRPRPASCITVLTARV